MYIQKKRSRLRVLVLRFTIILVRNTSRSFERRTHFNLNVGNVIEFFLFLSCRSFHKLYEVKDSSLSTFSRQFKDFFLYKSVVPFNKIRLVWKLIMNEIFFTNLLPISIVSYLRIIIIFRIIARDFSYSTKIWHLGFFLHFCVILLMRFQ